MRWLRRVRNRTAARDPGRRPSIPLYADEHGTFGVLFRWKEELVYAEGEGEHAFRGGWGVNPIQSYVPDEENWDRCLPEWLHGRRAIVVARLRSIPGHEVVTDPGYPAPSEDDFSWGQLLRDYPSPTDN